MLFLLLLAQDDVWAALDESPEKLKSHDPAKLFETLKKGRPVPAGAPGESKERIKDAQGRETDLYLTVPPGYSPEKRAGVLLALHGLGGNGSQMKGLLGPFAAEHGLILVCPTAQKEPEGNEDSSPFSAGMFKHWWFYRDVDFPLLALAAVKKRFAVDENRVLLAGASMGGFGTWNVGLRYPDRFAALLPLCGGISRIEFTGGRDDASRKLLLNAFNLPVYFIHGDADEVVPVGPERWIRDDLKAFGYDHTYVEVPKGKHDLRKEWPELRKPLEPWLASKTRKAHPAEVKHHAIGAYCPQSYWLRIDDLSGPAEVKASVKAQTIDFTATGAKKLTFFLDEALLDLSKPVKVTSKGKKVFEGKVKPSAEAVLSSWKAREDRDLLYRASVTVAVPN